MRLSVRALGAVLGLAAGGAITTGTPAAAGESTGCWRHLGCIGGPAYGYAPPPAAYGYAPPPPAYGYGPRRAASGYYAPAYGGRCYTVPQRFLDDWGRVVVQGTRVCD